MFLRYCNDISLLDQERDKINTNIDLFFIFPLFCVSQSFFRSKFVQGERVSLMGRGDWHDPESDII